MNGAIRQMRLILIIFKKKNKIEQTDHFGPKNGASSSGSAVRIFLNFAQLKVAVGKSNNNGLYRKNSVQDKWAILGPKMAHPHNSGLAQRIVLKFCRMKGANRYMKILLVVFFRKKFVGQFYLFSHQAILYCLILHGQIDPGYYC